MAEKTLEGFKGKRKLRKDDINYIKRALREEVQKRWGKEGMPMYLAERPLKLSRCNELLKEAAILYNGLDINSSGVLTYPQIEELEVERYLKLEKELERNYRYSGESPPLPKNIEGQEQLTQMQIQKYIKRGKELAKEEKKLAKYNVKLARNWSYAAGKYNPGGIDDATKAKVLEKYCADPSFQDTVHESQDFEDLQLLHNDIVSTRKEATPKALKKLDEALQKALPKNISKVFSSILEKMFTRKYRDAEEVLGKAMVVKELKQRKGESY